MMAVASIVGDEIVRDCKVAAPLLQGPGLIVYVTRLRTSQLETSERHS